MAVTGSRWKLATFLSVVLLCVALVVTTVRLRNSETESDALRQAVAAQREAIKVNRDGVAELCRISGVVRGLVSEAIDLRRFEMETNGLNRRQRDRFRMNIGIYSGYLEQLDQQTACREVTRP